MDSVKHLQLRPASGRRVRKEDGTLIPDKGCDVPNTRYYRDRLAEGDLVVIDKKPTKAAKVAIDKKPATSAKGDK